MVAVRGSTNGLGPLQPESADYRFRSLRLFFVLIRLSNKWMMASVRWLDIATIPSQTITIGKMKILKNFHSSGSTRLSSRRLMTVLPIITYKTTPIEANEAIMVWSFIKVLVEGAWIHCFTVSPCLAHAIFRGQSEIIGFDSGNSILLRFHHLVFWASLRA